MKNLLDFIVLEGHDVNGWTVDTMVGNGYIYAASPDCNTLYAMCVDGQSEPFEVCI